MKTNSPSRRKALKNGQRNQAAKPSKTTVAAIQAAVGKGQCYISPETRKQLIALQRSCKLDEELQEQLAGAATPPPPSPAPENPPSILPFVQCETAAAITLLKIFTRRVTDCDGGLEEQAKPTMTLVDRACVGLENAVAQVAGYFHDLEAASPGTRRDVAARAQWKPLSDLEFACGTVATLIELVGAYLCDYYEGDREGALQICGVVGLGSDSVRNLRLAHDVARNYQSCLLPPQEAAA